MRKNELQRIDRRKFLLGAGGAALALPMLETFSPRVAFGQSAAAPKRVVIVLHSHGRFVGNGRSEGGKVQDIWSPSTTTAPLTEAMSPLLAALAGIRNEIVTIDGVDNLVRHTTGDVDGHYSGTHTCLTCVKPKSDKTGGGPSIDYVMGQRLRASASQRASLVLPASAMDEEWRYDGTMFFGADGTGPALLNSNPAKSLVELFGKATTGGTTPPKKTLQDRLTGRRKSILDAVAKDYEALRSQVSTGDRERLDRHATFIRSLETRLGGGGGGAQSKNCMRPLDSSIPTYAPAATTRGALDTQITPFQIENLVQALACDVTRVASLHFNNHYDLTFAGEFGGSPPSSLAGSNNYHGAVHVTPRVNDSNRNDLVKAFQYFARNFALLVRRLSEVQDTDGSRLLDNTLVIWASDMGYGSAHFDFNIPIVMAGMKSAFPGGQGRHVVLPQRRSLGDLYAQSLRMLGGTDTTFGQTGTVGAGYKETNFAAYSTNFVKADTQLHQGTLEL